MNIMRKTADAPFQNKGRWHKIFLESNGSVAQISSSDIAVTLDGSYLKFPKDFHFIEVQYDVNTSGGTGTSQTVMHTIRRRNADGTQEVSIPNVNAYDWAYVYVFGYFN